MRHFLIPLIVGAFFAATLSPANAQVPRSFSYQGVVLDPAGHPISDGPHTIQLKLYNTLTGGSAIYTENQVNVGFTGGVFNVIIGSLTPIPTSVAFDKGYFLGVSIDASTEMNPRTAIVPAPYAIHASVADALSPAATGVVTAVNNQSGALILKAGTGAVVTSSGDTITIASTGVGGTGIQGVQNADPSIVVLNPTGPTASVAVAIGGITTTKIADGAVTLAKISGAGASSGMVLTANGLGAVSWVTPAGGGGGGLSLPFSGGLNSTSPAFSLSNTGTGEAGIFNVTNATSTAFALTGTTNGAANSVGLYAANTGSGRAGYIEITNVNSGATAFTAKTQGTGDAADVTISNVNNSLDVLHATTNGTGRAGYFSTTNTSPTQAALEVTSASTTSTSLGILSTLTASSSGASNVAAAIKGDHQGTTGVGAGVWGRHGGTGAGVFGSVSGNGGYGVSGTGFGTSSTGVLATYSGGSNGNALEINNGYIKVSGTNKSVYTHTTTVANIDPNNANSTILSYPGMIQTDMLIVTHVYSANRLNNGYGVWWNQNNVSWEIFVENNPAGAMPVGEKFNVLVIKQ